MHHFYEKLMNRMSDTLKPISSAYRFKPKKQFKEKLGFRPFITISREPGSGGRPIAKKIAKLTGFEYYNERLVQKVAKNSRLRSKLLGSIDEKSRTMIQDMIHSIFNPDYVSDIKYIRQLGNVILSLTERGDSVILGHGANFVSSFSNGLHVRVSAPYPIRVQRAIKHEKISEKKARKIIKTVDKDRKRFVSQYFSKNISNANYYDLVLNTSFMSIDNATDIILRSFERKFPGYLHRSKIRQRRLQAKR